MTWPEDRIPTTRSDTHAIHEAIRREFSDRCCPHCGRTSPQTVPRLARKWGLVPRTVRNIVQNLRTQEDSI